MWKEILKVKPANKKAQALILAYMVIASFVVLLLPLFEKIFSENLILNRQRLEREASYYAEGGIDEGINWFRNQIANFNFNPANPNAVIPVPPPSVYATGATAILAIANPGILPANIPDPDGTNVIVRPFIFTSTCQHPSNANITVTVKQVVLIRLTGAFQYAVFYNDDLEIFPGRPMEFNGRIFSNNDIYLGSDGSTLKVSNAYLRGAANIYNARKDGGTNAAGVVNIEVAGSSPVSYVDMHTPGFPYPNHLDSTDVNWLSDSQSAWNGTVQTSANGTTKKAVPVVGSIAPSGYYNNNAGIVVTNGTIKYNGTTLTEGAAGTNKIPAGTITTLSDTTCTSSTCFKDARENAKINMTTIDLQKLAGADGGNVGYTNYLQQNASGLLYATNSNAHPGVRLVNGSQIHSSASGLTVVTNDPLYIQGNYNNVAGVPSAVICDSVNLLSNSWNDANSAGGIGVRVASATTINTAFIAGVDTTAAGRYNGGLENYPRLLEDWSSKNLNISGAFVELWNTQVAQGRWPNTGTVYNPPNRFWAYDANLANNPPPFTPWAVEAQRGAWWKS